MPKLSRFPIRATLASAAALISAAHTRAAERRLDRRRSDVECYQGPWGIGRLPALERRSVLGLALVAGLALSSADAWALGSTPVTVVNPGDIAKSEGIQHPFQASIPCEGGSPSNCGGLLDLSSTDPNKRLVIEYYSVVCFAQSGLSLSVGNLTTTVGGATAVEHVVPIADHVGANAFGNFNAISIGAPVRIYADANSTVVVSMGASGTPTDSTALVCRYNLSGQLIDQ